ncbi:MAG: hypothetical protein J6C37_10055 [Roseburia sp.]|nr:hypothetical protein [Roseburia sp.]
MVGGLCKVTKNLKQKIQELNRESIQNVVLKMTEFLSKEQYDRLEELIDAQKAENAALEVNQAVQRMSQEFVNEKMKQIESWMSQIDEGELYLDVDEYEDYSSGYWDSDWITEYYDNQGIGDKIVSMIQFAKDCVDDRRYQEANSIYEWLWEMSVSTDSEYECEPVGLELLEEKDIIRTDMKQLALLTLYTDYQVLESEKRAEDIYLYFTFHAFQALHIEDMFRVGRENLTGTEQFFEDWIALLQTKSGKVEGRLLQEAVLYKEGIEGLVRIADQNCSIHPSLYLTIMGEYDRNHNYLQIENTGERALEKIDVSLKIRSEIALKAAYASSCLGHTEKMMQFCWEGFRSDSTEKNFLRLFGTKEMAMRYGMRGEEVLVSRLKGNPAEYTRNEELSQNVIAEMDYYSLCFYMGNFDKVKQISKNPQGSLGWSGKFIRYGIRLFLLYLYDKPLPSKAAASIAAYVGFRDETDFSNAMVFESEVVEESRKNGTSMFWGYFQRWKPYFQVSKEEKKKYLAWAEKIVYGRTDAIVGGQHRNHYGEVAALLALVGEIKESMEGAGAKQMIFAEYKRKFPRHSSFQAEMRNFFGE